ncbi:unnamed protein product, partial [Staurois parvus]
MYVKCFETKMTVSKIFKFAAGSSRDRRRWPGTLQGMHRGSEGQGKSCR